MKEIKHFVGFLIMAGGSLFSFGLWVYWSYGCCIQFAINYNETDKFLIPFGLSFVAFIFNSFCAIVIQYIFIGIAGLFLVEEES